MPTHSTNSLPAGWLARNGRITCTCSTSSGSASTSTASGAPPYAAHGATLHQRVGVERTRLRRPARSPFRPSCTRAPPARPWRRATAPVRRGACPSRRWPTGSSAAPASRPPSRGSAPAPAPRPCRRRYRPGRAPCALTAGPTITYSPRATGRRSCTSVCFSSLASASGALLSAASTSPRSTAAISASAGPRTSSNGDAGVAAEALSQRLRQTPSPRARCPRPAAGGRSASARCWPQAEDDSGAARLPKQEKAAGSHGADYCVAAQRRRQPGGQGGRTGLHDAMPELHDPPNSGGYDDITLARQFPDRAVPDTHAPHPGLRVKPAVTHPLRRAAQLPMPAAALGKSLQACALQAAPVCPIPLF